MALHGQMTNLGWQTDLSVHSSPEIAEEKLMSRLRMSFNNLLTAQGFCVGSVLGQMFASLAYITWEVSTVGRAYLSRASQTPSSPRMTIKKHSRVCGAAPC